MKSDLEYEIKTEKFFKFLHSKEAKRKFIEKVYGKGWISQKKKDVLEEKASQSMTFDNYIKLAGGFYMNSNEYMMIRAESMGDYKKAIKFAEDASFETWSQNYQLMVRFLEE
ncbi:hypothetical protein HYU07_03715 [Candidatus Woesearchaeota archaeon]|nr:hypothetical protein [Candidatus Woesearchaeota archaeon]